MSPQTARWGRIGFTIVLAVYGLVLLRTGMRDFDDPGLLHLVNLPIHETGHLVFMPFGETMQLLGGSLFQILVPTVFVASFARRRDGFAAFVCLWWVAHNLWDVSVYVGDARARALPLLGDDPDNHDWFNLLGIWDRLDRDRLYASRLVGIGTTLYFIAVIGCLTTALRAPVKNSPYLPQDDARY